MKQTSILNEKCECGRDIDYFELKGKELKEKKDKRKLIYKLLFLIGAIYFTIWTSMYFIFKDFDGDGFMKRFTFIYLGLISIALLTAYIFIKTDDKYNPKKARKSFISWKRQTKIYNKLNKSQRKALWRTITISFIMAIIPFLIMIGLFIKFIMIPVIEANDIELMIVLIIFLFAGMVLNRAKNKPKSLEMRLFEYLIKNSRKRVRDKHGFDIDKIINYKKYHRRT